MNRLSLSDRILEERSRNHLTQEELARRLGVSKAAVSKWECGQSLPDIALLPQIASLFSVTLDDLFGYKPLASEEKREEVTERLQALLAEDPAQAAAYAERQSARYWSDPELLKAVGLALYVKAIEPSISDEANCPEPTSRVADLAERILRRVLQLDPDGPSTDFVLQALCILLASEGREDQLFRSLAVRFDPSTMGACRVAASLRLELFSLEALKARALLSRNAPSNRRVIVLTSPWASSAGLPTMRIAGSSLAIV